VLVKGCAFRPIPVERNRTAGEVNRVAGVVRDHLYHVGVVDFTKILNLLLQRSHQNLRIVRHRENGGIDGRWIDQRLVALNVHDYLGIFGTGDFRYTVGAGKMIGARHSDASPKPASGVKYTWIVGGNDRA